MTGKTYAVAVYDLAESFLKDNPHLWTEDRCCELATLIQMMIDDFIDTENDNYEPKETGDAWAGGFARNH